eukprot:11159590-Lingulodinium_polyedra.AAC.1
MSGGGVEHYEVCGVPTSSPWSATMLLTPRRPRSVWSAQRAAWVYNVYQLHGDGRTSYERHWK